MDLGSAFSENIQGWSKIYKIGAPSGSIAKLEGAIPQPGLNACQVPLLFTLRNLQQYK